MIVSATQRARKLGKAQVRAVWFTLLCYATLQGIVPAGYMPSFSSSSPFALCHGDDASAQWLRIQASILDSNKGDDHSAPDSHLALDCSFSTFNFTDIAFLFDGLAFCLDQSIVFQSVRAFSIDLIPHYAPFLSRASPLVLTLILS